MQEKNKQLNAKVNTLQESVEFQNEKYEKMKKRRDGRETKTRNLITE